MVPGWAIDLEEQDPVVQARNVVMYWVARLQSVWKDYSRFYYLLLMMLYNVFYSLWNCWNIWHAPMHWDRSDQVKLFFKKSQRSKPETLMTRETPWWRSQPQNAPERKCHCPLEGLTCQGKLSAILSSGPDCKWKGCGPHWPHWRLWKSYGMDKGYSHLFILIH